MPATLDISCPNCGKGLKVPAEYEGKRVKCKHCKEAFAVKAPKGGDNPAAAKPAPAAPTTTKPKGRFDEDDDDGRKIEVVEESDAPRCPHCAKELDPPDAVVCKNCGFNNRTRVKYDTKKVWAPDLSDWARHLGPGILALLIVVGLITLDAVCWINMEEWMEGSALQEEQPDPVLGKKKFLVRPGAFTALIIGVSAIVIIPAARFAWQRLVRNFRPEERTKK